MTQTPHPNHIKIILFIEQFIVIMLKTHLMLLNLPPPLSFRGDTPPSEFTDSNDRSEVSSLSMEREQC